MKNKYFADHGYLLGFTILRGFEEMMTFQRGSLLGPWKTDRSISGMQRTSWMDESKYLKYITKDGSD